MENNENASNNSPGKKIIVILIIVLLLGANGVLLWQFFTKTKEVATLNVKVDAVTTEKQDIEKQKDDLQTAFDQLKSANEHLKGDLKLSDDSLNALQVKIQNLQGIAGGYYAAKAEVEKLKAKMKEMQDLVEAIQRENAGLKQDKELLNSNLIQEKSKTKSLSAENSNLSSKVALGSRMSADNVAVTGAKFDKKGKEAPVTKSKQLQKLKVCLSILENLIVDKGNKTIYIRLLAPDGTCLTTSNETFTANGTSMVYTVSQDFQYNNTRTDMCIYWAKGSPYVKGRYSAEIYMDGNLIGKGSGNFD